MVTDALVAVMIVIVVVTVVVILSVVIVTVVVVEVVVVVVVGQCDRCFIAMCLRRIAPRLMRRACSIRTAAQH